MKIDGFTGKFGGGEVTDTIKQPDTTRQKKVKRTTDTDRLRPDASFKIKDSLREVSESQPTVKLQPIDEKQVKIASREAVNELRVAAALEKYITDYQPEPTVAIALKTHHPEINQENIIIAVDNQLQLEKLEMMKIHLQHALAKTLNNGFITLTFKLFDDQTTKEVKKLYTAGEKFEHFLKLNPVLADLKNIFGLELE